MTVISHSECRLAKHTQLDHVLVCKEHQTVHCACCKSEVEIADDEYWSTRGITKFVERHRECEDNALCDQLEAMIEDILREQYLHIGVTLLGEVKEKMVICIIHESEPLFAHGPSIDTSAQSNADSSDDIACVMMTVDMAYEVFGLDAQQILGMNEECPYILLAIDGMRYVRELGWGEIAHLWQQAMSDIAKHLDEIKTKIN